MSSIQLRYLQAMSWLKDEDGQDLVEYALIVVLISIAALVGMTTFGTGLSGWYDRMAVWFTTAPTP